MSETPYSMFKELRPEKRLVANTLVGLQFDSVLEFGSQWGEVLMGIKDKFPEVKLVGVDIDKPTTDQARSVTNLDLRLGDVLGSGFHNKEFDVVVADALFCMLRPEDVETAFKELVRIARKYIVLVELEHGDIGLVRGGRTGANWEKLCQQNGLAVTKQKVTADMWDANPWIELGYVYLISFEEKPQGINPETGTVIPQETIQIKKSFCDQCTSKGVRHLKSCPKAKK